jgi:NAD-dependent deacetylase
MGLDVEGWIGRLRDARRVTVLTGAGISAESGVPTFRGEGGLWREYRAEELATPEAFARDPHLVWEWYDYRRELVSKTEPNAGHRALVDLETRVPSFLLITQNVDNLHQRSGSEAVCELHGNLFRARCSREGTTRTDLPVPLPEIPPKCECGALLRPDVVWFGEALPEKNILQAQTAAHSSEVMFVIGTSAVVYPAAALPQIAKTGGAFVVEVNIQPTPISSAVDVSLIGPAAELLPAIVDAF